MEALILCVALNIYFEARNEPTKGQIAVSQVVLNRTRDSRFPNDPCSVVYQAKKTKSGKIIKHKCQFSWYCDGLSDKPKDYDAFRWSYSIAKFVMSGHSIDLVHGSTHYHTIHVNPEWNITKVKTTRIGRHIFYKWLKGKPL